MDRRFAHVLLGSLTADTSEPPSEFRIFKCGANPSTKGTSIFDAEAAAEVMRRYTEQGVEYMIDLEHESLADPLEVAPRADAKDARGWFKLELRNRELWAVDVRWTPDGLRRLTEKTQRYISPAFYVDTETNRIVELTNVAMCAMPATHGALPLVAATKLGKGQPMDPALLKKALDALIAGDTEACANILKDLVASAAAGGAPAPSGEEALADGAPEPKPEDEMASALQASNRLISELTQKLAKVEGTVSTLDAEREAEHAARRAKLVGELVTLGAETPATAYADGKLVERLAKESVTSLEGRIATLRAKPSRPVAAPPVSDESWTESEQRQMSSMTPDQQTKFKALRASRRVG